MSLSLEKYQMIRFEVEKKIFLSLTLISSHPYSLYSTFDLMSLWQVLYVVVQF